MAQYQRDMLPTTDPGINPGFVGRVINNMTNWWNDHDSGVRKWSTVVGSSGNFSGQIVGTTTNDNATAGNIGEYVETGAVTGSWPAIAVHSDAGSISLTAGDWDVEVHTSIQNTQATVAAVRIGISTTAGNSSSGIIVGVNEVICGVGANQNNSSAIPRYRLSLSATTTVYFKLFSDAWTTGAPTYTGNMSARRVR